MTRRAPGFSLIEMAFVLIIVTLLLGGLLVPFATQVEQKRIAETQKAMEEIKEALLGFAVANGRLPCPDLVAGAGANDGLEDPLGGPCAAAPGITSTEGNLPWATLGVANSDAWGNRFRYRVTNVFARSPPAFTLADSGTLSVCGAAPTIGAPNTCPANQSIASNVPAVVLSSGKNGFGGVSANTGVANFAPISDDEKENTTAGNNNYFFVSRIPTAASAPCDGAGQPRCEFDDLVIWLSPNVLFNRMVAAGKLPY
ncbi:MAG: type II secretion system protein [Burkholderiales bacterium]|nr:type II secretion system protein [Burkholderiales bacterium]